ncbi:hypothetical protein ABQE48_14750 [Mycolicibacterium thermoresistibile]
MALVAVIAVTAVVSVSVAGGGDGSQSALSADDDGSEYASADDTGPVNIITEDPTCAAWRPINNALAEMQKNGWEKRDASIPASEWTPEVRLQYEEVGRALSTFADQISALAKNTPHRVMRELYQQVIVYSRAYVDSLPTYSESDDAFVGVVAAASATLLNICAAIRYDSAASRVPLIEPPASPSYTESVATDSTELQPFIADADSICEDWEGLVRYYDTETADWQELDANIPATAWTSEQRAIVDAVIPIMKEYADELEELGRASGNRIIEDFAVLAAQYRRAYTAALPSYNSADSYLTAASARAAWIIVEACQAAKA